METTKLTLSVKEAADSLSISPWTVRRWITDGKLKVIRLGRRVMVEPSELRRLVDTGRKPEAQTSVQ